MNTKNKVVTVSFKLSGPRDTFKMSVAAIKDYVKQNLENEEVPFTLSALKVEVENSK